MCFAIMQGGIQRSRKIIAEKNKASEIESKFYNPDDFCKGKGI